jgi:Ca-activated chloride channel family protein
MGGPKLDAGKRALKAALRGLGANDRFRLIAFDDTREFFLTDFSAFDRHSLAAADEWIDALQARGGTEMLPALLEAFSGTTPPDRVRTVLFITDGQASNEPELASAVASHRSGALLFTVGIDTAVNESLLERLARLGGGTCELMSPSDDIEDRLAGLEARLARPAIWAGTFDGGAAARPDPIVLFHGRGTCQLIEGAPARIRFTGITAAGPVAFDAEPRRVGWPLAALWARERVAWLEDQAAVDPARERGLQAEVVALATAHGIASRFTAFVAVERTVAVDGTPVTVVQPVELPDAWDMPSVACLSGPMSAPAFRSRRSGRPLPCEAPQSLLIAEEMEMMCEAPDVCFQQAVSAPGRTARGRQRPAFRQEAEDTARDAVRRLVLLQGADGSFGGDAERTAAAIVALLLLGHTTRRGTRRRVVEKAADWLRGHGPAGAAAHALRLLERADAGGPAPGYDEATPLFGAGEEGAILRLAAERTRA